MKKRIITIMTILLALGAWSCEKEDLAVATSDNGVISTTKGNGNGGRGNNGRGGEHANPNARGKGVTSQRGEGPAFGEYTITLTAGTEGMEDGGTVTDGTEGNDGSMTERITDGCTIYL